MPNTHIRTTPAIPPVLLRLWRKVYAYRVMLLTWVIVAALCVVLANVAAAGFTQDCAIAHCL